MATNTSNSTHNYDDLVQLNDQTAITLIPAIALLGSYMILGLVGNSLVCYIMGFRLQASNQSFLIVCLAIFDLLSCLLSIPQDILELRFSLIFPSEFLCKILCFITVFNFMGSIFTLVLIAVDRYRKICKPLDPQISPSQMKKAVAISVTTALLLSWPAVIMYGLRFYESPIKDQMAHDCSISDKVKDTIVPIAFPAVLFLVFIVSCVVLTTLYITIMVRIKQRDRKMKSKKYKSTGQNEASNSDTGDSGEKGKGKLCGGSQIPQPAMGSEPQESNSVSFSVSSDVSRQATVCVNTSAQVRRPDSGKDSGFTPPGNDKNLIEKRAGWRKVRNKTNIIAFLVTLVFILSFLPYLSLEIAGVFFEGYYNNLQGAPLVLHRVFYRSYYINSVSNPIIYGVLNTHFRLEAKILFRKLFCCK